VDAAVVGIAVGEDAARAVVLDEDDDEVVDELKVEEAGSVVLLWVCDVDVERGDKLEVVGLDVKDANAEGKSWPSGHPVPSPWQGSVKQQP
jgi:hypothetical protein